ncbi:hypothetical protein C8J56DRAFT_1022319 [Mycena floridula]|nr:hypothetical protein C8J56DRAFT_1022319 [Mycena floridula]
MTRDHKKSLVKLCILFSVVRVQLKSRAKGFDSGRTPENSTCPSGSLHTISAVRMSAVEGYAFWGQLNSLYESDGLRFWVILEVCKRRIDPVIEYDRVHGPLIVKELPYLRTRGRLALLPVSQISSGRGGGVYDF